MQPRSASLRTNPRASWGSDTTRLALAFWLWKILLLLVAVASPGPGYDTSSRILLGLDCQTPAAAHSWFAKLVGHLVVKLTRWDSIYFTTSSARGHLFEQEWAFSQPAAKATSLFARGIVISHISHFLAVLTLYRLTYNLIPCSHDRKQRVAFTAAGIHIVSPAGLFLLAFNGEASFALFNFLGMSCYITAKKPSQPPVRSASYMIASGVAFGIASMVRSNGLLSGLILAWDAMVCIPKLIVIFRQRAWHELIRLSGTLFGGLVIAAGYLQPQVVAYQEYCMNGNIRPWCRGLLPGIYTWVQSHYWGVGFLRYWTLSNLPLFALATPMVLLLLGSGWAALSRTQLAALVGRINAQDDWSRLSTAGEMSLFTHTLARFALPQLLLAVLATTNFHVQIINRISSGYSVWYIVLAIVMQTSDTNTIKGDFLKWLRRNAQLVVRASIMYAVIQGGLYASFMPPA